VTGPPAAGRRTICGLGSLKIPLPVCERYWFVCSTLLVWIAVPPISSLAPAVYEALIPVLDSKAVCEPAPYPLNPPWPVLLLLKASPLVVGSYDEAVNPVPVETQLRNSFSSILKYKIYHFIKIFSFIPSISICINLCKHRFSCIKICHYSKQTMYK